MNSKKSIFSSLSQEQCDIDDDPMFYQNLLHEEDLKRKAEIEKTLSLVKSMVSLNYYIAIVKWIDDSENGIWGNLKIVDSPQGDYQTESNFDNSYWSILKGMWVLQFTGYCSDDYSGFLTIKLREDKYLEACFSL